MVIQITGVKGLSINASAELKETSARDGLLAMQKHLRWNEDYSDCSLGGRHRCWRSPANWKPMQGPAVFGADDMLLLLLPECLETGPVQVGGCVDFAAIKYPNTLVVNRTKERQVR